MENADPGGQPVMLWPLGWVLLPGTRTFPEGLLHRQHPGRPLATFCDRVIGGWPVVMRAPADIRACPRCEKAFGAMRHRRKAALVRNLQIQRATGGRFVDTDSCDRAAAASRSVRTASGGLPGPGGRR